MEIIIGVGGVIVGIAVGYGLFRLSLRAAYERERIKAEQDARRTLEQEKKEWEKKLLEKEDALSRKEHSLIEKELKLKNESENLAKNLSELTKEREKLDKERHEIVEIKAKYEELRETYISKLYEVSSLSPDEAERKLFEEIKESLISKYEKRLQEIIQEYKMREREIVQKVVIEGIQRIGAETASQHSIIYVQLKSDADKGKLIGREGRNINAFESLTGVDLIIDDTPEMVGLSCHDPVRREIARIALEMLLADGRIHPATIEQAVEKAQKIIDEEIMNYGKKAIVELGIGKMHPELIRYIGKMHFRSSFEQNLLKHSIEVAKLCGTFAAELGLDVRIAKRAGLLHDIGKVVEDGFDKPHAIVGMELCQKYGEPFEVCNAVGSHHNDIEMRVLYAPLVQACDAISGARPGARRETTDIYLKRLEDLENIALSFSDKGIEKAFVIQGGRELRVIVSVDKTTEKDVDILAEQIAQKIEESLNYPGQIKVVVIREYRKVAYAK